MRKELSDAREGRQAAEDKYGNEMMLHAEDIQVSTTNIMLQANRVSWFLIKIKNVLKLKVELYSTVFF